MEMSKCASKSEPDTCEYYTTIQYDSMCRLLRQKSEPWYGYFNSTTMPITCPFPKGAWEMKGIKIGLSSAFPLLNGFWRFKNRCYGKNKKLNCCFFMEMTVSSHFGRKV
ncbi:unnamed protein product [Nezara viridula]|uniref:Uncharacterized protein n=1 Tax=Nezara viridula TaxID=85310 RepID=A0A9P0MU38_NEZVI|nr:unnamed protein product [Nezara viridula]